jgi:hypothetical protein
MSVTLDYKGSAEVWAKHDHGMGFDELRAQHPQKAIALFEDAKGRVDRTFDLARAFLTEHDTAIAEKIHERSFSICTGRTVSYPMNFSTYYRDQDHFATEFLHEQAHHHFVYPTDASMAVTKDLVALFPPESVPWDDPRAIEGGGLLARRMEHMAAQNPQKLHEIAVDVFGDSSLVEDPQRLGSYIATYGHLVINLFEFQSTAAILGEDKAHNLALANPGYTWIYETMLEHQDTIESVLAKHHATLKDPPAHKGHVVDAMNDYAVSRGRSI